MKDKKRYVFLDILRLGAFILVFFYHFLVRVAENEFVTPEVAEGIYAHPNFHVATLGVSLFFLISGMGLMISSEKGWNLKNYFKKRFWRIYIPFYIASAGVFTAMFFLKQGKIFETAIPFRNIIFTIAGIDGYVKEFGIETFSLGVGEWFLGCLIIMYCLFPLLRLCMLKRPKIMLAAVSLGYVLIVFTEYSRLPVYMNFGVKLYEFILGMFLGKNIGRIKTKGAYFSIIPIILFLFCPFEIPLKEGLKITVFSAAVLIFMLQMEDVFAKTEKLQHILTWFGKYSFEMYLIHHWGIIIFTKAMVRWGKYHGILPVMFAAELILTILGAILVNRIAYAVQFCYNKFLKFESVR